MTSAVWSTFSYSLSLGSKPRIIAKGQIQMASSVSPKKPKIIEQCWNQLTCDLMISLATMLEKFSFFASEAYPKHCWKPKRIQRWILRQFIFDMRFMGVSQILWHKCAPIIWLSNHFLFFFACTINLPSRTNWAVLIMKMDPRKAQKWVTAACDSRWENIPHYIFTRKRKTYKMTSINA